jgi:uncharacterized protein (DUF849 family)
LREWARRPQEHPALPVTAAQLAGEVAAAAAADACAVHLHVRDARGADTLDGAALAEVLTAVGMAVPGVPVGVTTGAWALPGPAERVAAIGRWRLRPAFASVNWHEDGAEDVAAALLEQEVAVEAGLWHADAVDAWLASAHRERCLRVLLELPDGLDPPPPRPRRPGCWSGCAGTGDRVSVLLHGEGSSTRPACNQ